MAGQELVDRAAGADQYPHRGFIAAACPPQLLPGGGDAAGIAAEHGCLHLADVDAELEGVGGDDAPTLAAAQPPLDLAPLARQVSAAVAADVAVAPQPVAVGLFEVAQQHLDLEPAAAEDDGLGAGGKETGRDPLALEQR